MNKLKYIRTLFLNTALLFIGAVAYAQPEVDFDALRIQYPDDDVLILEKQLDMRIILVDGKPEVFNEYKQVFVFLTDKANYYATKSVGYSEHFEELLNLEAVSYVPDKGKLKKMVSDSPEITDESSGNIFYDDSKKATVIFKSLQKGSIAILNYTIKCNDPHMLHSFTLGGYAPVAKATLNVEFPDEVNINPRTYGNKEIPVQFTSLKKKNKNIWTWEAKDLKKYEDEPNAPEYDNNTYRIFPLMKDYYNGEKTQRVLSDVNDLFAWYVKQVKGLNDIQSPELKQLADSLTKGKTELEKIKSIYYWVQDNIRYVAIEDGWGGFVPRKADDVCSKRYGDCKDMANLATNLLNLGGVKAYLTWIGTREIPFTYNEVPSTNSDNHMISAIKLNGEWVFLDATSAFIDFGIPSEFIQGKEALIMLNSDSFLLEKVKPVKREMNTKADTMEIKIENNLVVGKGNCTYGGYWKWELSNRWLGKHVSSRYNDIKRFFSTGNNKCKVDTVIYNAELKSRDVPLEFDYKFSVPDYIKTIGKDKYVNLNMDKVLENNTIDTAKRKNPYEFDYKSTETLVVKLQIPQNMKVSFVPPNRNYKNDLLGFELSYKVEANTVTLSRTIYFDTLELGKKQFEVWNNMTAELNKAYKELIVLTEK